MPESITPKPEEKKTIKNEYDFRRELLKALEKDSSSNNEVKDTEIYRQHILHALGQEFDQDDIKQTNNFRAKVVDGVKNLVDAGGGGSIETATVIVKNNYRNYATVYFIEVNADGQLKAVSNSMMTGQTTTFSRVAVLGDKILFKTESGRTVEVTSGSAQMKSKTEAIITGDCSLTITA